MLITMSIILYLSPVVLTDTNNIEYIGGSCCDGDDMIQESDDNQTVNIDNAPNVIKHNIEKARMLDIKDKCNALGGDISISFESYFLSRYGHRAASLLDELQEQKQTGSVRRENLVAKALYDRDMKRWKELTDNTDEMMSCSRMLSAMLSSPKNSVDMLVGLANQDTDGVITKKEYLQNGGFEFLWRRLARNNHSITLHDISRVYFADTETEVKRLLSGLKKDGANGLDMNNRDDDAMVDDRLLATLARFDPDIPEYKLRRLCSRSKRSTSSSSSTSLVQWSLKQWK